MGVGDRACRGRRGDYRRRRISRLGDALRRAQTGRDAVPRRLLELSPLVEPRRDLADAMVDGRLEGLVLKDRRSPYRGGSRTGWARVKPREWYEREAWQFEKKRCAI